MNLQVFCMDETIALLFINMNFSWSCSSWSKSSIVLRKRERTEKNLKQILQFTQNKTNTVHT